MHWEICSGHVNLCGGESFHFWLLLIVSLEQRNWILPGMDMFICLFFVIWYDRSYLYFCEGNRTFGYLVRTNYCLFQQHGGDITNLSFITDAVQSVLLEMGLSNDLKELSLQEGVEVSLCSMSLILKEACYLILFLKIDISEKNGPTKNKMIFVNIQRCIVVHMIKHIMISFM